MGKKRCKRVPFGSTYYAVWSYEDGFYIQRIQERNDPCDERMHEEGNYYADEEEAKAMLQKISDSREKRRQYVKEYMRKRRKKAAKRK